MVSPSGRRTPREYPAMSAQPSWSMSLCCCQSPLPSTAAPQCGDSCEAAKIEALRRVLHDEAVAPTDQQALTLLRSLPHGHVVAALGTLRKLGLARVIDLSATPFFLSGSGYVEGTLFPWTMSDFSLMDAIECGIVKLPRVPVAENMMRCGKVSFDADQNADHTETDRHNRGTIH